MRRKVFTPLLFIICTFLTSYFIRLGRGLLDITYKPPLLKSDIAYLAKRTGQLGAAGLGEEVTRRLLSRLGSPVDLHVFVIAAAPLDYWLLQTFPSWDLAGLGPCHHKLRVPGTFGGCAHCQAHFCYQYSTFYDVSATSRSSQHTSAGGVDLREMARCYRQHEISVKDAQDHWQRCHSQNTEVYQLTYRACAANVVYDVFARNQSCDLTGTMIGCAERFGTARIAVGDMLRSRMFGGAYEPCPDGSGQHCVVGMVRVAINSPNI